MRGRVFLFLGISHMIHISQMEFIMDSQIAKDLDGILTVLGNHFGSQRTTPLSEIAPPDPAIRAALAIMVFIIGGWLLWKVAKSSLYVSTNTDDSTMELPAPYSHDETSSFSPIRTDGGNSKSSGGFVYLIRCKDRYKIGLAVSPQRRLSELQTSAPDKMQLIHTIKTDNMRETESRLHHHYRIRRVHREWFALTNADVSAICAISTMNYAAETQTTVKEQQ